MIVKCIDIYNESTKQYLYDNTDSYLTKNHHYNVLEIMFTTRGIYYRIISDRAGMRSISFITRAKDFEIVSNKIPPSWILDKKFSDLSPASWMDISLWQESFWQDLDANRPKAVQCYRDEIKAMIALDKEYIQVMIDERSKNDKMITWNETMIPLFNEVLEGGL